MTIPLALAALLLAACGTTEAAAARRRRRAPPAGPVTSPTTAAPSRSTRPATKVVSLEWGLTENLLTLGVTPVGAADVKGYNTWDTAVPLDASTPDVGLRGEPSLDAIAALDPDLVVTTTDLPDEVIKQIEASTRSSRCAARHASDPIGHMRSTLETWCEATGTQAEAADALADFDAAVADGKATLADAGRAAPFTFADGWRRRRRLDPHVHAGLVPRRRRRPARPDERLDRRGRPRLRPRARPTSRA